MYRGTTPTITFNLDLDVSNIVKLIVTFAQNGKIVFERNENQCAINTEENSISLTLTEEETLSLKPNSDLSVQIRFALNNGVKGVSRIASTYVENILHDGVL